MFTGLQLVTLGLLAELQVRTYHESQKKVTYVIREIPRRPPARRHRLTPFSTLCLVYVVIAAAHCCSPAPRR
jgi:hypothetical protein